MPRDKRDLVVRKPSPYEGAGSEAINAMVARVAPATARRRPPPPSATSAQGRAGQTSVPVDRKSAEEEPFGHRPDPFGECQLRVLC
jgi:hypothetical protein